MNNPYGDPERTDFFRNIVNLGSGVDVLATRPGNVPVIIGGATGNGDTLVIGYDWADVFSQANADTRQLIRNALDYGRYGMVMASVSTTVENVAPVVTLIGGPFTIDENGSFVLSGTFTDPGLLDVHTVQIDWNGDGVYDQSVTLNVGERSWSVTSPVYVDDAPSGTAGDANAINVRISDADGGMGTAATTVTVNNVAPAITGITALAGVDANGKAVAYNPVTFQIGLSDPSLAATENFRYEFDWDGNGTVDQVVPATGFTDVRSISITHEFTSSTHFQVRGVDDDGGVGAWTDFTLNVVNVSIVEGDLVIAGSSAADNISVNTYTASAVTGSRNGVSLGSWDLSGGSRVIIRGGVGSDVIAVNGPLGAEVFGGDGNDYLYGGSGDDQLWGEAGDDYLSLGSGNDVGIGGLGRDLLYGGNGDDLLIGGHVGSTTWNWTQLQGVSTAWRNWDNQGTPPTTLANLRDAVTDNSDAASYDRFWGNTGKDAFVVRSGTGGDQVNSFSVTEKDYLLALLS
jgi:hypothetical protein